MTARSGLMRLQLPCKKPPARPTQRTPLGLGQASSRRGLPAGHVRRQPWRPPPPGDTVDLFVLVRLAGGSESAFRRTSTIKSGPVCSRFFRRRARQSRRRRTEARPGWPSDRRGRARGVRRHGGPPSLSSVTRLAEKRRSALARLRFAFRSPNGGPSGAERAARTRAGFIK